MKLFNMIKMSIFVFLTLLSFQGNTTPDDAKSFADPVIETRYKDLVKELRCPKCQNQNLADSNSQIAIDLRNEVYNMLHDGKADMEIMNYMVERYGDFVLYRPRVSSITYILWFGPAVLILIGIIVVVVILRRKPQVKESLALSEDQQSKLNKILEEKE